MMPKHQNMRIHARARDLSMSGPNIEAFRVSSNRRYSGEAISTGSVGPEGMIWTCGIGKGNGKREEKVAGPEDRGQK